MSNEANRAPNLSELAERIIQYFIFKTDGLSVNQRAMVGLLVCKLINCTIETEIVDVLRMVRDKYES